MPEGSCGSDTHRICPVAQGFINLLYSLLIEMADFWRGPHKGWSGLPVREYPSRAEFSTLKHEVPTSVPVVCCVCGVLLRWSFIKAEMQGWPERDAQVLLATGR